MSKAKISEFRPQVKNANKHTPRGLGQLSNIIGTDGWVSAITVCNDGETIDGSARLETAYEIFGDEVEPIIVRSRGDRPIIHIREDIESADDPRAIKLSVAANRIAQIDLDWDVEVLAEIVEEVDLSSMFFEEEIQDILAFGEEINAEDFDIESSKRALNKKSGFVKIVLSNVEIKTVELAITTTGMMSRSDALNKICLEYLKNNAEAER